MYVFRTSFFAGPLLLTFGCGTPDSSGGNAKNDMRSSQDQPAADEASCDATAQILSPASSGVTDFYFRDNVVFSVSNGADTATITLEDEHGEFISGTTWIDDAVANDAPLQIVFTPDTTLAPTTEYVALLEYCGGTPSVSFRTSALGTPIDSVDALVDDTFSIDLSAAQVIRPSITAQALLNLVDDDLMMQIHTANDDQLGVTIGALDLNTNEQNTCLPTIDVDVPGNFVEAPTFVVGPVDVPFSLASYKIVFYDAYATATFYADGSSFAGGTISGSLDARDVVEALSGRDILPSENPRAVCLLVEAAGMSCTECRDGEPFCLAMEVQGLRGERMTDDVEWVDQSDCHESCAASCDNDACEAGDEFPVCDS